MPYITNIKLNSNGGLAQNHVCKLYKQKNKRKNTLRAIQGAPKPPKYNSQFSFLYIWFTPQIL